MCASIYILALILFIPFAFSTPIHEQAALKKSHEGITVVEFPHHQVGISSSKLQTVLAEFATKAVCIFIFVVVPIDGNYPRVFG